MESSPAPRAPRTPPERTPCASCGRSVAARWLHLHRCPKAPQPNATCTACGQAFRQRNRKHVRCRPCVKENTHPLLRRACERCGKGFVATSAAKRCTDCRYAGRKWAPERVKYVWTPERDAVLREIYGRPKKGRTRFKAEAAERIGFPEWQCMRRAALLGLTHATDRRDWTPEEELLLRTEMGRRSVDWIADRLGRSLTSVVLKLKRERLSRRAAREWRTSRDVADIFGIDSHAVTAWITKGWLRASVFGRKGDRAWAHQITDDAIVEFIAKHPKEFRLDKVDQEPFMDLLLEAGGLRQRIATRAATAAP